MATQLEDLADNEPLDDQDDGGEANEPDDQHDDPGDDQADNPPSDDEEDQITFGAGDVVRGEDETPAIRNQRERIKQLEREKRELEARIAPAVEDIGPEPDPDDEKYWDNREAFKADLRAYDAKKRQADDARSEQERLNQSVTEEVEAGRRAYAEQRAGLKVPGFDAADDAVATALPDAFLNALNLAAGPKAAALRFYLGTHPDELGKLKALDPRKVTDLIKCAAMAGAMAKEINVTRRKPTTQPERVHAGGSGGSGGRPDGRMARLESEAAKTGDYSAVVAYMAASKER